MKSRTGVRAIGLALATSFASCAPLMAQRANPAASAFGVGPGEDGQSLRGVEPTGPVRSTPRGLDGKPDLTGYWKPVRERGKPGGNMGKDLAGSSGVFSQSVLSTELAGKPSLSWPDFRSNTNTED